MSTFYAELQRIKSIMAQTESDLPFIFLIDEIFKGTNSTDRLSGAQRVLSSLNQKAAVGMITTHDMELCNLADLYSRIKNYSFSEFYQADGISFDYKITPGRSQTTNAKYLMEMVGIL
jgi:DNA mismatch repair ATPase MutS